MKKTTLLLTAAATFALASTSQAAVIYTSATDASATASVGTDLLQTSLDSTTWPTESNINNGTTGAFIEESVDNPAYVVPTETSSLSFFLDVAANPLGYDISQIDTFSGWKDNRAGQRYTIYFSTVDAPTTFDLITPGGTGFNAVNVAASATSLVTHVFDDTTALLGTGVHTIRFDIGTGSPTVWREIDVIGAATIPEPSSVALLAGLLGLGHVIVRRRR